MSTKKKCKDCNPCEDQTIKTLPKAPDCEQPNPTPCPFILPASCISFPTEDEDEDGNPTIINLYEILADLTYTNTTPMPEEVGGYPAGTTFNAQTIQQMFDGLLYPYQHPAFTSFARTNLAATYEVGANIPIGSQTFTWATSNSTNIVADTVEITQNFAPETVIYGPDENTGSEVITLANTITSNSPTTILLYTIEAENTQGDTISATISASWRFRTFHGTSVSTSLNEAGIEGLASNPLSTSFAGTKSFAAGGYKYICYPASFGTATSFTDAATNLNVPMEAPSLVSVTNSFGVTTNYRVHRSTNILGGSINIIVA